MENNLFDSLYRKKFEILYQIIYEACFSENLNSIYKTIIDVILDKLSFNAGGIYIKSDFFEMDELIYSKGLPEEFKNKFTLINISENIFKSSSSEYYSLFNDEILCIEPDFLNVAELYSSVLIPLSINHNISGTFFLGKKEYYNFSDEEKKVFDSIGNEIGQILFKIKTNDKLFQSVINYKEVFELSPEAIVVIDTKANVLSVNNRIFDWIGFHPDEIINTNIFESQFLSPESKEIIKSKFKQRFENLQLEPYNLEFIAKDGNIRIGQIIGTIIKDDDNKPLYSILMVLDITDRKKSEDLLRDSEEKFHAISSSAQDAIIMIDNNGCITYWNEAAKKIFGYRKTEAIGQNLHEFLAPKKYLNSHKEAFPNFQETGEGYAVGKTIELSAIRKDGIEIPIELSLSSVKLKGKWNAIGVARDISQRKNSEKELRRLVEDLRLSKELAEENANELIQLNYQLTENEAKLKELNAMKDKFFSIIAHDLKSPFSGFLGLLDILTKELQDLSKQELEQFTNALYTTAKQIYKLLENLLQWSRIQRRVIEYLPSNQPLKDIFNLNIEILSSTANNKKISIINDTPSDTIVYTDLNIINTIIRNLLSNAIKFTNYNGTIRFFAKEFDENSIVACIKDNGVGMDKNTLEKIWAIDTYHTSPGTADERGTGLGLILCKELTEINQGKIWVESILDVGTTFYFTIPKGKNNVN